MKKYFQFDKHGTSYKNEILGGITTFLSMAYILAVNPQILSLAGVKGATSDMKMDQGAIFVATALAAFVGSLFMGLIAKYPIALAPGMGLNAFFAFTVVLTMGIPWQVGLTGVLFSGIFFALLTVTGLLWRHTDLPCPNLAEEVGYGGGGVKISAAGVSTAATRSRQ